MKDALSPGPVQTEGEKPTVRTVLQRVLQSKLGRSILLLGFVFGLPACSDGKATSTPVYSTNTPIPLTLPSPGATVDMRPTEYPVVEQVIPTSTREPERSEAEVMKRFEQILLEMEASEYAEINEAAAYYRNLLAANEAGPDALTQLLGLPVSSFDVFELIAPNGPLAVIDVCGEASQKRGKIIIKSGGEKKRPLVEDFEISLGLRSDLLNMDPGDPYVHFALAKETINAHAQAIYAEVALEIWRSSGASIVYVDNEGREVEVDDVSNKLRRRQIGYVLYDEMSYLADVEPAMPNDETRRNRHTAQILTTVLDYGAMIPLIPYYEDISQTSPPNSVPAAGIAELMNYLIGGLPDDEVLCERGLSRYSFSLYPPFGTALHDSWIVAAVANTEKMNYYHIVLKEMGIIRGRIERLENGSSESGLLYSGVEASRRRPHVWRMEYLSPPFTAN